MAKINILTKEIYNRISAGEVVERPYSAVKELVENSLDAGATEIEIYIEKGGKQLIKVVDNGCGIEKDDMKSAFIAHATSKISSVEDLDKITTLGFRGEALASIASISKTEIVSVTEGNEACRIVCDGGRIGDVEPAALAKGTEITVYDLFYNTPVRAKFLKTDKGEENDITNFVSRFILGNPEVSFKYFIDSKLHLQSHGGGLDEAVAQVYGAKTISQCFKINADRLGIKISGFIGNQNFFKPNRSYQSLFLNGRYIVNNTVNSAMTSAYASYAMKRQYPFYVLFIEVPVEDVDVNVHPNKADVRFSDTRAIYSAVYNVVSSVLDGTVRAADFVVSSSKMPEMKSTMATPDLQNNIYSVVQDAPTYNFSENEREITKIIPEEKPIQIPKKEDMRDRGFSESDAVQTVNALEDMPLSQLFSSGKEYGNTLSVCTSGDDIKREDPPFTAEKAKKQEQIKICLQNCIYKGNLFNTYLIYELNDEAYLIDQHAAHERLIFDSLNEKLKNRTIMKQGMLVPYIFSVNVTEGKFLSDNLAVIREMGFDIEPFGVYSYRVDEVPVDLQHIDLKAFFDDLLSQVDSLKGIKLQDMLKDKIATTACKHAIKGGMALTNEEVEKLFALMDGNIGLKCPHGRPVCVKLTKTDIEKMFKRIV